MAIIRIDKYLNQYINSDKLPPPRNKAVFSFYRVCFIRTPQQYGSIVRSTLSMVKNNSSGKPYWFEFFSWETRCCMEPPPSSSKNVRPCPAFPMYVLVHRKRPSFGNAETRCCILLRTSLSVLKCVFREKHNCLAFMLELSPRTKVGS